MLFILGALPNNIGENACRVSMNTFARFCENVYIVPIGDHNILGHRFMTRNACWLLIIAALVLCTAVAWGQSQNGSLSGQVTDKTGAAIPAAALTLRSP